MKPISLDFNPANSRSVRNLHAVLRFVLDDPDADLDRGRHALGQKTGKALVRALDLREPPEKLTPDLIKKLNQVAIERQLLDPTQVKAFQGHLALAIRKKLLKGVQVPEDEMQIGKIGPGTTRTIAAFQRRYKLKETGEIDTETAERMRSVATSIQGSKPQPKAILKTKRPERLNRVVNFLRLNMKGPRVADLQTALAWLGHTVVKAEHDAQVFGRSTRDAVEAFQKANGLNITGRSDGATVKAMNRILARDNPHIAALVGRVRGSVRDEGWDGVAGATLRLKSLSKGTILAERTTFPDGFFDIIYDTAKARGDTGVNLLLELLADDGSVLDSRKIIDAARVAWANFTAGDVPYGGLSTFELVKKALVPVIREIGRDELVMEESDRFQDFTFATRATDLPPDLLLRYSLAHRVVAELGEAVPPEVVFAFLDGGLPPEMPGDPFPDLPEEWDETIGLLVTRLADGIALLAQDVQRDALEGALSANTIPRREAARLDQTLDQLSALRRTRVLEAPLLVGDGTLGQLLETAGIDSDLQTQAADSFADAGGLTEVFWEKFAKAGADEETRLRLGRVIDHALIARNHQPMLDALEARAASEGTDPRVLAKLSRAEWKQFIDERGVEPPAFADAADDSERVEMYAASLADQAERLYPDVAMLAEVARVDPDVAGLGVLAEVVDANPDLDLRSANILKFDGAHGGVLGEEGVAAARAFQRIRRLSNSAAGSAALIKTRLLSTADIVRGGESFVVSQLTAEGLDAEEARTIVRRASVRHAEIVAKISQFRFDLLKHSPGVIPNLVYSEEEIEEFKAEIPDIESLFGSLDFCDCPHGDSLYSPAAYLVDLLRFLKTKPAVTANTRVLNVLHERRPDIARIKLNQKNTFTPVPFIDLINEVLEHSMPPAQPDFDLQTTRSAEDLAATPEHLRAEAYDALRDSDFPIHSSLNLSRARTRRFLELLGAPRAEIMQALSAAPGTVQQDASAIQIAAEGFGISAQDLARIAPAADEANAARQDEYWGFDTSRDAVPVSEFLRKSGLDYSGLLALVDARFPNPAPSRTVIDRPFDDCDIDKQTLTNLTVAKFDRIQRFLRLQRHTDWKIWELDLLLLHPALGNGTLDGAAVAALGSLARLQKRTRLETEELLAFFGPLDSSARLTPDGDRAPVPSHYERVFLSPLVARPPSPLFARPLAPAVLDDNREAFLAPLLIDDAAVRALADLTDGQIGDDTLGIMFRWSRLARHLGVTVQDVLTFRRLTDTPVVFGSPEALETFLDRWEASASTSVDRLEYMLRTSAASHLGLRDDTLGNLLDGVRVQIAGVTARSEAPGESHRDSLERLLARRPELSDQARLAQALDLIDGSWPGTDAERTAFIAEVFAPFAGETDLAVELTAEAFDDGDALTQAEEIAIETRRRLILQLLRDHEARNLATQWASERFDLSPSVARLLLAGTVLGDGRSMMAHLLEPAFVAQDADGTFASPADRATFPDLFVACTRLHKTGVLFASHDLDATEVAWLLDHGAEIGVILPADLPVEADPPVPPFAAWETFEELMAVRAAFPAPEGATIFDVLDVARDPAADAAAVETALAQLVQRPAEELAALRVLLDFAHPAEPASRDYLRPRNYTRLAAALKLARRLGAPIDVLGQFARWEPQAQEMACAQAASDAARAKYDLPVWLDRLQTIEDDLREARRDALVAFLIENSQRTESRTVDVGGETVRNNRYWERPADVSRFMLIDVEHSACQPSSRIRQAISSVQMFVQRCFLNLESQYVRIPVNDSDLTNNWSQWRWRRSYRIWEANRKVLFYPENWIRPELRDDKTPFFKELENDILQNELTEESAEEAYQNYLEKLQDVADVEVTGVFQELPSPYSRLHVVARARSAPHTHYYRYYDLDYETWSPWERIDADIAGEHAMPVIYNRRLHVFWLEIEEKPEELHRNPPAEPSKSTTRNPEPGRVLEIKLGWTEKKAGGWTAKKVSDKGLIHPWARPHFSYHLRPRYRPADNLLWVDLFVSTSEEFNDSTFLSQDDYDSQPPGKKSGYKYAYTFRSKTRFNQTYRPWHSSSFVFDGAVKRVLMRGIFAHYFFPKEGCSKWVSSLDYVQRNFGDKGRRIEKLKFPDRRGSEILPTGMHAEHNRFVNNTGDPDDGDDHANTSKLSVRAQMLDSPTLLDSADAPFEVVVPVQALSRPSMIYQDRQRSYFIKAEWRDILQDYQTRQRKAVYTFYPFFHPYADLFKRELSRGGIDGLLTREIQIAPETFYPRNTFNFSSLAPVNPHRPAETAIRDVVDFSFSGAYSDYNWELFFHIPFYLAIRLSENRRFDVARDWFHRIFRPTSTDDAPAPQRYWITKPFFEHSASDYREQRVEALVANADEHRDVITAWANNPFLPHLIARYRPVAYQRAVVMRYLDTLIAEADDLFRRDTMEATNEAAGLYLLAAEIMGDPPARVPALDRPELSFAELEEQADLDLLGNAHIIAQVDNVIGAPGAWLTSNAETPSLGEIDLPYFCLPPNDQLTGYWETVGERLFNIRNCRSIDGIERTLDLFAPPIDPALLVKAAASGSDLGSVISMLNAPAPNYRTMPLLHLARSVASEAQRLSEKMLSALEKQDAEVLAQLRADHQVANQRMRRELLDLRVEDAEVEIAALAASRSVTEERERFFGERQSISELEAAALGLGLASTVIEGSVAVGYILAGGLALIPSFIVGASGFGGSPHVISTVSSGETASYSAEHAVSTLQAISRTLDKTASHVRTHADYQRRAEDWRHTATIAGLELAQIDERIAQAEVRLRLAERERADLEREIERSETEAAYLSDKFTNQDLFAWLSGQLSTLSYQAFSLAYDVALQAQRAYQLEIGDRAASFVGFGHWDGLRRGLLAADRLVGDLNRMEASFMELNRREFEITKHVSLASIAPMAFLQLKLTGQCTFDVPEWAFDMDYPRHFFRRLKNVSMTVPAVVGRYGSINCTLSLTGSRTRISPLVGGDYAEQAGDPRFVSELGVVQSIATSSGRDDSGMFVVGFDDPRFLPFEGAGAISTWHLDMRAENNQFDIDTVTDIVLHLRYTARDGGANHGLAAQEHVDAVLPQNGMMLLRLSTDFPDDWHRFQHPAAGGENRLDLEIDRSRFPFFVRDSAIRATSVDVVVQGAHGGSYVAEITAPGEPAGTEATAAPDPALANVHHAARALVARPQGDGPWSLAIRRDDTSGDFTALPEGDIDEVMVLIAFELA